MATSDFAQKLLHDLRLRKERMANTQNSDMYSNSRKNFKGSKETRTLEVGPKAGSRYRNSSNSQKTPARPQGSNQIVPYGGGHHSGQVTDLSMALAYAFDNRGKLKRLDIASSGPMMKILQQIGRKSTQQSFEIQWQSTNQFPNLTNLHINEISKGAQKLNQLLRACSTGGINLNRDSIEIGKELWKGAMELEQSLRMLVSLQEASSDNMTDPQRKSRLRLLDDNENSEDDSVDSVEKQRKVECPVFSFDKPSKNSKASVQKLTIHTHTEDRNSKPESHTSITSISTPHRRTISSGSELNTSQLTTSSTSRHNAARLPNVIAKLMGLEEIPPISNLKVTTERSASQQRSRDSISTHTSPRSSKNGEVKIEYTRPATKPVNQIRMQSNKITTLSSQKIESEKDMYESTKPHFTALDRENSNWRLEERQGTKNYVQESKTAISKINELQTKSMNLIQSSKTQNEVRKETHVKSTKQKQAAAEFTMHGNRLLNTAETTDAETLDNSNNQEKREAETNKLQLPQKKHRNIDLQQTNIMSHQPHGENLKAENRSQAKANHINEYRKKVSSKKMQSSRIIARDMKILQKQQPARKEKARMKSAENNILAGSKALLSNDQIENRDGKNASNDGRKSSMKLKSESEMTKVQATSYMETRSETKEKEDRKPKIRPTRKMNQEINKAVIAPREISRPLKPHESTSQIVKQNKRGKINASRAVKLANESLSMITGSTKDIDEPSHQPICEESQQNEDVDQMDTSKEIVQTEHSHQQQEGIINIIPGDMVDKSISNIYDDHQEMSTYEVRIKAPVTPTDGEGDCKVNSSHQQKQHTPMKVEKQEPLTEVEMFLKQKLIQSHLFLNTAEALFKLNIPISILNYASDQICEARDCKVILDCGYELLKRKGRRKVEIIYPYNNRSVRYTLIKSLDDLVRQLHKDFEALRLYGTNEKDDYDYANSILKMLESDIYNILPDLNSMWDLGWNKEIFPCANMDEVICNTEQLILDQLMNELINDCL